MAHAEDAGIAEFWLWLFLSRRALRAPRDIKRRCITQRTRGSQSFGSGFFFLGELCALRVILKKKMHHAEDAGIAALWFWLFFLGELCALRVILKKMAHAEDAGIAELWLWLFLLRELCALRVI